MRRQNLRAHVILVSVIIGDLDIVSIPFVPTKTDAVLLVDTNAILTLTVSPKSLETVAERHAQIF